jgi:hypothetical protein
LLADPGILEVKRWVWAAVYRRIGVGGGGFIEKMR